jgi:hypothetical protein
MSSRAAAILNATIAFLLGAHAAAAARFKLTAGPPVSLPCLL